MTAPDPHGYVIPITDLADPPDVRIEREVQWANGWRSWQRVDGGGWTSRELDWPAPTDEADARRIAGEQLERGEVA